MSMPTVSDVVAQVALMCEEGERAVGCSAPPFDQALYACRVVFPEATDEQHELAAYAISTLLDAG